MSTSSLTSSLTNKGQITTPSDLRKKLQLQPGDKVIFEEKDGVITITLADDTYQHASVDDIAQATQNCTDNKSTHPSLLEI